MSSTSNDAIYHLVDRAGTRWPAVQCGEDMIPAHEVEARPSGDHLPVLLLPSLQFTWALDSDTHEFNHAARQHIPNGPQERQLQDAFASVVGSDMPRRPAYPDLGYWRSEMVARDLQNIVTSSSDESDNNPAPKKPMPPSRKDAKRSWKQFRKDNEFGEEFGHGKKIKVSSDMGKHTHRWFPDENDNDAKPPVGYFDKLRKEKQEQDRDKEKEDLLLSVSDDDDSASDGNTTCGVTSDSSDEDSDEETGPKPTPHARHLTKESSVRCVASTASDDTVHALSAPRVLKLPSTTSTDQSTSSKSPSTKPDQTHSQLAITQLCREFDTARTKFQWDQAETAVSQLMALAPWSDDSTILIAKVAFRVKPHRDLDQGFEDSLREAVAEHISWGYERLRETRNSIVAMLFQDHEDLAEIVYDRRLKALREKRAEVIEISD